MEWEHGQKRRLAMTAMVGEADLQAILRRQTRCNPQRAAALADACKELGIDIPLEHWLWNKETTHSAFIGDPILDLPKSVKLKKRG